MKIQLIMDHLPIGGPLAAGTGFFRRRLGWGAFAQGVAILGLVLGESWTSHFARAEAQTALVKRDVELPVPAELQSLQGIWEGVLVGDAAHPKITLTITGNSLHFHRDTNFWFETTFALPAGKNPKQLHATIQKCPASQADSIGQVVRAFFKIEDGTLTLATLGDDTEETPKGFEAAGTRYELRKASPAVKKSATAPAP